MKLYPAIDLIGGRCVRLLQGDFGAKTEYELTPSQAARRFEAAGASYLHIVDLDGAKAGCPKQTDLISSICRETRLTVQAGGGIRTLEAAERVLQAGASRVVLGSLAVTNAFEAMAILKRVGPEGFTLALDVRAEGLSEPSVAITGWTEDGGVGLWEILGGYVEAGLKYLLCTDIGRDGTLLGPNLDLYRKIQRRFPNLEVQASGGVGSLSHLTELKTAGISAAIIGRALYEGKIALEEALQC